MEGSAILSVWRTGEVGALTDLLAEDATFSSPVADYRGRENAAHMLGLIGTVIDGVDLVRRWGDEREAVSAFTARIDNGELQGILREERDPAGKLVHVTLFLRPYRVVRAAIATMQQRLADSPLPQPTA
jgi:hypothetical protein